MIETAIVGGPVAILAYLIFYMYRKDRKDTERRVHDVHEAHSERLEWLLKKDQDTREQQTKALTELTTIMKERLNGDNG